MSDNYKVKVALITYNYFFKINIQLIRYKT